MGTQWIPWFIAWIEWGSKEFTSSIEQVLMEIQWIHLFIVWIGQDLIEI
jgi:hypothetical protein